SHGQRRDRHQKNGEGENPLAPELVAEMRQHDAAHRTHQIARRKDAESLDGDQPVRHVGREEQMADDARKEHEDDEIIKLQRAAKGRQAERAEILPVELTRTNICVEIYRCHRSGSFYRAEPQILMDFRKARCVVSSSERPLRGAWRSGRLYAGSPILWVGFNAPNATVLQDLTSGQ